MKKFVYFLLVAIVLFVLCSCDSNIAFWQKQSETTTVITTETTAEVRFATKEVALNVGDTNELVVIAPENADLKWYSSDTSVVKVDNGTVKGISRGTVTITVKLGQSIDTCIVKVKEKSKNDKKTTTTKRIVQTTVVYQDSGSASYTLGSLSIQNDLGGRSYLDSCTDWKIQEMINEILARNHYKFKTKEWFNYFSTFDWYFYNTSDMSVAESRFNSIERANYTFLAKYRNGN